MRHSVMCCCVLPRRCPVLLQRPRMLSVRCLIFDAQSLSYPLHSFVPFCHLSPGAWSLSGAVAKAKDALNKLVKTDDQPPAAEGETYFGTSTRGQDWDLISGINSVASRAALQLAVQSCSAFCKHQRQHKHHAAMVRFTCVAFHQSRRA